MIRDDILLAETLSDLLSSEPEIELLEQVMSSTTFRFVPLDLHSSEDAEDVSAYLDWLNTELSAQLESGTTLPLSEERVRGTVAIRACVVDTGYASIGGSGTGGSEAQVREVPCLVAHAGHRLDAKLRCRTGLLG
jgi:hypothetical protein